VSEDDLKSWIAGKVVRFKIPKKIWIVPEIPKTATGKTQRRKVAEAMLKKENPSAKL